MRSPDDAASWAALTILSAPAAALILRSVKGASGPAAFGIANRALASLAILIVCAGASGLRWLDWRCNLISGLIVYVAYCFLSMQRSRWRRAALRRVVFAAACVPIVAASLYAVLPFNLGSDIEEWSEEPSRVESIGPSYTCEWRSWGIAISDAGDDVTLYETFAAAPYLRRKLVERVYFDDDPVNRSDAVRCDDLLQDYRDGHAFRAMRSSSLGSVGTDERG